MKKLSRTEAVLFHERGEYKGMTDREIALFQLQQDRLCVPIDVFKQALAAVLGRPVYTHELVNPTVLLQQIQAHDPQ